MSPSPDTQDSNSSTSVVMTSSGAPQHQVLAQRNASAGVIGDVENPYLAGLTKKTRGLKKKMDKIKRTEALSASGKVGPMPLRLERRRWFFHITCSSTSIFNMPQAVSLYLVCI